MKTKYSEVLKQNITIDETQGTITTSDGTLYYRSELALLKGVSPEKKAFTHQVKQIFNGRIIK